MKVRWRDRKDAPEDALPDAFAFETRYEKFYEMLLDAVPSSVLLIDEHLRVVSANQRFLEKTRRSAQHTIGHRLDEVFPSVIVKEMELERRIQQVFTADKAMRGERMTYRAPGIPLRIYYYSIVPMTWDGIVESVMLLMDDVTEQIRLSEEIRQVERHLASVVESASDIVVSTDPQGRILTWNRAAEEISGFRLDEVKNRFLYEFYAPQHWDQVKEIFSKIGNLKNVNQNEWDLMTIDGQNVSISWVYSTMQDESGTIVAAVAVGRTLTEHRKLEAQVLQSQKLAALGVMAGGIAHEIRNPLGVASSAAQFLIEDDKATSFQRECADKIHRGIRRTSAIIEALLRFARPSTPKGLAAVNLVGIINDSLSLLANEAKLQKTEVVVRVPDTPVMVTGHADMLQQVAVNLVLNAYKAMPAGGKVDVALEQNGGEALLRISDTGLGIPQDELDNIFDPFYTTRPVGEGMGLGLSLCYAITKQHSGVIEVESVEGVGTTFTIRLPLHRRV